VSTRIHYTKPSITEREVELATDAARNGWGERCYDYIVRFEQAFADHLGVKHAIATSSCTGALHMGMAALGIGPGDEVIMGDINWIASAAPVTYLGAKPILVDVLRDTWCLDPEQVEASITPRTKAILAVHLYGNLCELGQLLEIGKRHGIPVIEDSAEAIGSVFEGARAGSIGAFGTFSFHGTKTLTTGTIPSCLRESAPSPITVGVPERIVSSGPTKSASNTRCPMSPPRSVAGRWNGSRS
jgi:perosamine synthetase